MILVLDSDIFIDLDILGTAHCANMYPESPLDPPQLLEARKQIQQHIMSWLHTDSQAHHVWS